MNAAWRNRPKLWVAMLLTFFSIKRMDAPPEHTGTYSLRLKKSMLWQMRYVKTKYGHLAICNNAIMPKQSKIIPNDFVSRLVLTIGEAVVEVNGGEAIVEAAVNDFSTQECVIIC